MSDAYEVKRQLEAAKESLDYVEQGIDEMEEDASKWGRIEDEGYYDADEVLEVINNLSDWQEFYDRYSLEPDEVEERLKALSLIEEAAGGDAAVTDEDDARDLVESLKGGHGLGGVLDALQLLIAELRAADILPRTDTVPASGNNVVASNPPTEMSFTSTEAAGSDNQNNTASV